MGDNAVIDPAAVAGDAANEAPEADPAAAAAANELAAVLANVNINAKTKIHFDGVVFDGEDKTTSKAMVLQSWLATLLACQAPPERRAVLCASKLAPRMLHHLLAGDAATVLETWSWDAFTARFESLPAGRTLNSNQAGMLELERQRHPTHARVESAVHALESITSTMTQPPNDATRIHFTLAAIHPALRNRVMHDASGRDWPSYLTFRQHLLSQAAVFEAPRAPHSADQAPRRNSNNGNQPNRHLKPKHNQLKRRGNRPAGGSGTRRPLEDVECFNCHRKGHYANKCPDKKKH